MSLLAFFGVVMVGGWVPFFTAIPLSINLSATCHLCDGVFSPDGLTTFSSSSRPQRRTRVLGAEIFPHIVYALDWCMQRSGWVWGHRSDSGSRTLSRTGRRRPLLKVGAQGKSL